MFYSSRLSTYWMKHTLFCKRTRPSSPTESSCCLATVSRSSVIMSSLNTSAAGPTLGLSRKRETETTNNKQCKLDATRRNGCYSVITQWSTLLHHAVAIHGRFTQTQTAQWARCSSVYELGRCTLGLGKLSWDFSTGVENWVGPIIRTILTESAA